MQFSVVPTVVASSSEADKAGRQASGVASRRWRPSQGAGLQLQEKTFPLLHLRKKTSRLQIEEEDI